MARKEEYDLAIECHVYDEDVMLTSIDIGETRVEVEFEDGTKLLYYTAAEVLRRQKVALSQKREAVTQPPRKAARGSRRRR